MTRSKKIICATVGIGMAVLVVAAVARISFRKPEAAAVPTTRVQRGQVDLTVITDGELQTPHVAMIVAPPVSGALQIIKLAKPGTAVKAGEVILEFDPSEQEYNLEQSKSRFQEAEQQIIKAQADAAVQAAQDKVTLLQSRFDVRRAELEVGKNELVGEIDAQKNNLALKESKRHLAQVEQDVKSRQASNSAGVAVLVQQREQARMQMQQAQRNIESMQVKSPIDGIISVKENWDAGGGMYYSGMVLPEYREGDQVWPGRMVAQVLDMGTLELAAKITETDRVNIKPGVAAVVDVDAAPGRQYSGKVKSVAGLASRSMWSADSVSKFDTVFEITNPDAKLRPGASAQVTVRGASLPDALYLPRECVFVKDGKPVGYSVLSEYQRPGFNISN
jgi:multidrug resistance efflux pump